MLMWKVPWLWSSSSPSGGVSARSLSTWSARPRDELQRHEGKDNEKMIKRR